MSVDAKISSLRLGINKLYFLNSYYLRYNVVRGIESDGDLPFVLPVLPFGWKKEKEGMAVIVR